MTELIYFKDCYAKEFDAKVILAQGPKVILDRTAFYPQGGGQPFDTGTLAGEGWKSRVTEVSKEGSSVIHLLADPIPRPCGDIHGTIDWERRHAHMRYHTAQHLLSAHFLDRYRAPTTGNQIWEDKARIDFDLPQVTPEIVEETEAQVNRWIKDSLPVTIEIMDRRQALTRLDPARTRIDRLPKSVSMLRIVTVDGVDSVACAGTHVRNTSEIGTFHITKTSSKGKGRKRVEFVLV